MGKLTERQRELLQEISERPRAINTAYKPAQKLVIYGFATFTCFGYSDMLHITDAGRAALEGET